jgi:pimeloyl-ACP methyl ester carboxylesterase
MAQFKSGDFTLAYDDVGPRNGPAIVLVHGFSANRNENWQRTGWYGAFERKRMRCLAFDHRGHGESDKPHDPAAYGRDNMTDDIFALMDHAGLEEADVRGFSMGAGCALVAAIRAPHRVHNLILGGVGGKIFDREHDGEFRMAKAMETDAPSTITEPMLKSFRQFADEQGEDRLALAACTRAQSTPIDKDALARLTMPVLVVAGAYDALAGDPQGLADLIPGARAITLPGCDHFSAIAHGLYKAAVFDFLEGYLD